MKGERVIKIHPAIPAAVLRKARQAVEAVAARKTSKKKKSSKAAAHHKRKAA